MSAALSPEQEWERAYDEAMRWRDWQTCELLLDEREAAAWYTPDMGCAACQGDPESLGLHVCGKEYGECGATCQHGRSGQTSAGVCGMHGVYVGAACPKCVTQVKP